MINKRKDFLKTIIFIIKKYCKIEYREDLPLFGKIIFNLISFKNKKRIRFIINVSARKVYFFYKKKKIHLKLIIVCCIM